MNLQETIKYIDEHPDQKIVKAHTADSDFTIDKGVTAEAKKWLNHNQYTPTEGITELRQAIAEKYKVRPDNILVGCGSRHLLFGLPFISSKNQCNFLLPDPEWAHELVEVYWRDKHVVQRVSWENNDPEDKFVSRLIENITQDTDFIVLSNPNNPTGRVLSESSIRQIVKASEKNNCLFIEDRAYEDLIISRKKLVKPVSDSHIILGTVSKAYAMTGYRVGYLVATNEEVITRFRNYIYQSVQCIPYFTQKAAVKALQNQTDIVSRYKQIYRKRLQAVKKIFYTYEVEYINPQAYPFVYISTGNINSELITEELLKRGVAVVASNEFSQNINYFRFALMDEVKSLRQAAMEIASLIGKKPTSRQQKAIQKYFTDHQNYQTYCTTMFDNHRVLDRFYIGKDVLRPDKSWVSYALTDFLLKNNWMYKNKKVLDMGAGQGIQGIACAVKGAKEVVMAEIEETGIENIKANINLFNLENKVKVTKSDLFVNVSKQKFDVIIFNHPFFPYESSDAISRVIYSGSDLLDRFFKDVKEYSHENTVIVMPFSDIAPFYNNPKRFAFEYHYNFKEMELQNNHGKQSIFLIGKSNKQLELASKKGLNE